MAGSSDETIQLNRSEEAIEAIKWSPLTTFFFNCIRDREEQIHTLQAKLKNIEEGNNGVDGNQLKLARSQGKKIQITVFKVIGELGMGSLADGQVQNSRRNIYRKALSLE